MKITPDYPLFSHNTFGIQVRCQWFVEYCSVEELQSVLHGKRFANRPFLHIGQGSNLLFVHDFDGVIFHSKIDRITILEENDSYVELLVGSGMVWDDLVAYCVERGWYGAENLSLIPGEVGAAAIQNIGAYGVEVKDLICSVEMLDVASGKEESIANEYCNYGYRTSIFKEELKGDKFITGVRFRFSKKEKYSLEYGNIREKLGSTPLSLPKVREAIIAIRTEKLPDWKTYGNAGSFFMNPSVNSSFFEELKGRYPGIPGYPSKNGDVKVPAAWLIDRCSWKGKRMGRAGVWPQQPLVLVNYGGASGADVVALAAAVKQSVLEKFGIELSPEVMYI